MAQRSFLKNTVRFLLPVSAAPLLFCSNNQPVPPTGMPVWADDGSEIACAVNREMFDAGLFMNHETEQKYDLVLYNDQGEKVKTILSGRMVDGYTSSVEEIYYMKTRGYLLVKTLMYNSGGQLYEKIDLDGKSTRLFHLPCEAITDKVIMVPSPAGTFIAKAYLKNSGPDYRCRVTFLDSTGTTPVDSTDEFTVSYTNDMRWRSDSVLELISGSSMKVIGRSMEVRDSSGAFCTMPATSSSAFREGKGYIAFNGGDESITFADAPPVFLKWCR